MHILLLLQIVSVFSSLEKMTTGGKKEKKKQCSSYGLLFWISLYFLSLFFPSISALKKLL